jgi:hypothetical protein
VCPGQDTKPLSVKLQAKSQDIHRAVESVKDCVSVLQQFREGDMFQIIFKRAETTHGEAIPMPRLTARQRHRSNVPASNAEEYYRRAYYLPFLDTCISQLNERFTDRSANAYKIRAVIPAFMDGCSFSDLEPAAELFVQVLSGLGDNMALKVEFMRWQAY